MNKPMAVLPNKVQPGKPRLKDELGQRPIPEYAATSEANRQRFSGLALNYAKFWALTQPCSKVSLGARAQK